MAPLTGRAAPGDPVVRYATTAEGERIAYSRIGRGPLVVESPHLLVSHQLLEWEIERARRWLETIAAAHTLVRYDGRGIGLSRGAATDFSLEAVTADLGTVANAAGAERFALFGRITGCLAAIAYAAAHPERVSRLVLWQGFARDEDQGQQPRVRALMQLLESDWELFTESMAQAALGWSDAETARAWAALIRESASPALMRRVTKARRRWDVTALLPSIRVPTLVLFSEGNAIAQLARSEELAAAIPGARLVVADSAGGMPGPAATAALLDFLDADDEPDDGSDPTPLSARQLEVLRAVATGATNQQVADELGISVNTVTRHLTHVYAATGAANRLEAVRVALDAGWLE